MAKLLRKKAYPFGLNAGFQEVEQFGSFANGGANYTMDVELIQALSSWLEGWFSAVIGGNAPTIEDMNAFCYVAAYQVAYLMQTGVPEFNTGTTYFIGSIVNDGLGNLFVSIADNNTGNAVTNAAWWKPAGGAPNVVTIDPSATPVVTLTANDSGKTYLVKSSLGAVQFNLPALANNFSFKLEDKDGSMASFPATIHRVGAESIQGLAADFSCAAAWGSWNFISDGVGYFIS